MMVQGIDLKRAVNLMRSTQSVEALLNSWHRVSLRCQFGHSATECAGSCFITVCSFRVAAVAKAKPLHFVPASQWKIVQTSTPQYVRPTDSWGLGNLDFLS